MNAVRCVVEPQVEDADLDVLFAASWPNHHAPYAFSKEHERSLTFACAYDADRLVGYVNVAWDGGIHAFLLNPTVHPDARHRGIGTELVRLVEGVARDRGLRWLHVDFESRLKPFYERCGFVPTSAGLIELRPPAPSRRGESDP